MTSRFLQDNTQGETTEEETLVPWSTVWVTLLISLVVGLLFYLFFLRLRSRHSRAQTYDILEIRQFHYPHRSPAPFGSSASGCLGWAREAYAVPNQELLRCVGLDSYMFVRFLRWGARVSAAGTLLGCVILIPIYATGGNDDTVGSEQFNSITLAKVEAGSNRLWAAAIVWCLFCAWAVRELWVEWRHYAPLRYDFLSKGDDDTPQDYRYAVQLEHLPRKLQSNAALRRYLERLFPEQVRQVNVLMECGKLEALVKERQGVIQKLEQAVAMTHAKPDKPAPQVKVKSDGGSGGGCCGGGSSKVDAIAHYNEELERLNQEIDAERAKCHAFADSLAVSETTDADNNNNDDDATDSLLDKDNNNSRDQEEQGFEMVENTSASPKNNKRRKNGAGGVSILSPTNAKNDNDPKQTHSYTSIDNNDTYSSSSTAFVTFTSLRAKMAAIQVQLSGKVDYVTVQPAPIPAGIVWRNAPVPALQQRHSNLVATVIWLAGVLFWAVPVTFVTGLANINSLLEAINVKPLDAESFYYGLLSGILPVVLLQILMFVLYLAIGMCAMYFIRSKSMPQIDAYTFFWHQLFQFANLWLILIGGSIFNQLNSIINDPGSLARLLASAIPGASPFFVNLILMGSFLAFGLELSMIPQFAVNLIMGMLQPEAARTQRMLDEAKKPQSILWGKILPPMIFVVLVMLVYMPIVPLMEPFALVYFGGWYLVYKHQCLHVYAQEFEGGGLLWGKIFIFIMVCLYMAEVVVIAYLGIKEGIGPSILCVVPLVGTIFMHFRINRNIIGPLKNLSFEVAADVDIEEGELSKKDEDAGPYAVSVEQQLYGQPCLKASADERAPMPYRRAIDGEKESPMPYHGTVKEEDAEVGHVASSGSF